MTPSDIDRAGHAYVGRVVTLCGSVDDDGAFRQMTRLGAIRVAIKYPDGHRAVKTRRTCLTGKIVEGPCGVEYLCVDAGAGYTIEGTRRAAEV